MGWRVGKTSQKRMIDIRREGQIGEINLLGVWQGKQGSPANEAGSNCPGNKKGNEMFKNIKGKTPYQGTKWPSLKGRSKGSSGW